MKPWIATIMLAAVLAPGGVMATGPAAAAETSPAVRMQSADATDRTSRRRAGRVHRHHRHGHHPSYRVAYSAPRYLGRPVHYAPAIFPLGFDFGFGWW